MHPRSRTRCRDPPSGGGGGRGRHRRRSPPPPSPRHQRRPPQPLRRSPDRAPLPRRHEEIPIPTIPDPGAADRRSRADILLEAGRLAAHYLVAQGVIPDHLLRAREDPNHTPAPRPEPPAPVPASTGRKRVDDDDPRWRRSGDWGRAKGDDDRQSRRSGWDRRSHSFDDRRKYSAAADVGARRTRDYDEPKRPPMSRSYSHNDRRASGDGRGDPRRRSRSRSRSRSRTRTRSSYHYGGSRRESDGRPSSHDLDHTKRPDSAINPADAEMPRKPKVPSSVVVAEVNHSADLQHMGNEDGEMESEMVGLDHPQDVSEEDGEFAEDISEEEDGEFAEDVSEEEDGEFAVDGFNDEDGAEMDVTERQLSDVDVPPSESIEEPERMRSQLSNVEEEMEAGAAPMDDACMVEPSAEKDGCFEMEAPQSEVETGVGDLNRDEQELPAWYKIFDLNVVETPEGFEMPVISSDSPADHVSDSVPDLSGQMNQQAKYGSSQIQGQDEHAVAHDLLRCGHDLSKYDLNNVADGHEQEDNSNIQAQDEDSGDNDLMEDEQDSNKSDLNDEAGAHTQDNNLLSNEEVLLSHGMAVEDSDDCHLSIEQMLLKQNADEEDPKDHHMENERMLVNQTTPGQVLDTHHMSDEQLTPSHVTDEQLVNKHHMEPEPTTLPMDVHDMDSNERLVNKHHIQQMLLNNGTHNDEEGTCRLNDGELLLDHAVDGQVRVHDMGNGRTVPVIDLEDDYKQQLDTRDSGEFLESISDQETSSFPDSPHANIQAVCSSSVAPNFGNQCTGRGDVNSEVIPGDDYAPYVAFDKMPLEVINVWDLPSSELGKTS